MDSPLHALSHYGPLALYLHACVFLGDGSGDPHFRPPRTVTCDASLLFALPSIALGAWCSLLEACWHAFLWKFQITRGGCDCSVWGLVTLTGVYDATIMAPRDTHVHSETISGSATVRRDPWLIDAGVTHCYYE